MRKNLSLILLAVSAVLCGQEIMKNSSFDQKNIWQDAALSQPAGHFAGSQFTEDKTWNNCLKLELKKLAKGQVGAVLLIGKDGKKTGFAAKPETTYEFSFEAKGTVPGVTTAAMLYHNDEPAWKPGASKRVKTTLGNFRTPAEWTKFRGTFRTGSDTIRAALVLQFWAKGELVKKWKPGQYLLVDNISIRERKSAVTESAAEAQAPQDAPAVPAFLAGTPNTFGEGIPFEVRSEGGNAVVTATLPDSTPKKTVSANGSGIWADDVVEVFFSRGQVFRQFALASGGGRYSRDGQQELKDYSAWKGSVEGRTFTFEIPWKLIGFDPQPGTALKFNIGAQFGGKTHFLPPVTGNFHDVQRYPLLIFGPLEDYLKKQCPGAEQFASLPVPEAVGKMRAMKQAAALKKAGKAPFAAARFSPVHGFSMPLEITAENLLDPARTIELTALVNEHKVLPLAILNRTGKTETYRIVVRNTDPKDEIDRNGLDGGFDGITLREALSVKDSDAAGAGRIFDPLPKMNEAQTLTVEPGAVRLCWITFDCVKAGTFRGVIRIIPLGEPAQMKRYQYSGKMQDYPLTLKVLDHALKPLRAGGFWGASQISENFFRAHQDIAPGEIQISPWIFSSIRFDGQGNVTGRSDKLAERIRTWYGWFRNRPGSPKIKIVFAYSVYDTMVRANLPKNIPAHSPLCMKAFQNYLRAVAEVMREAGVPADEYAFELVDEPRGKYFERHLTLAKAAREALPNGIFFMTWAPKNFGYTPEMIRKFLPHVKHHLFHHLLLNDPEYQALFKEIRQSGGHYGHYVCSTSMREDLHRYYRLTGWKGARIGAEYYHVYILCEIPWGLPGPTNWKLAAHGGLLLRTGDNAIPTIRSEALREGYTDLRYLELLNDPDFTRKAVEKVMMNQHDPSVPEQIRAEVIRRLESGK